MTYSFNVQVREFSTLQEIEGQWAAADFSALLDEMEFGDRSGLGDAELREMCLMSLQDLEPEAAAYIVLKHVIGDELREGQLRNMANEMREEKLWEEYVEPAFHGRLFTVGSLLFAALPDVFPKTDAVVIKLVIKPVDTTAKDLLAPTPDPAFLVRLLAAGMDDHAVLNRLYSDQISGAAFPNANDIVWISQTNVIAEAEFLVEITSSGYWLDALERTEVYEAQVFADETIDE